MATQLSARRGSPHARLLCSVALVGACAKEERVAGDSLGDGTGAGSASASGSGGSEAEGGEGSASEGGATGTSATTGGTATGGTATGGTADEGGTSASTTAGTSAESGEASTSGGIRLDVGGGAEAGSSAGDEGGGGNCECGVLDFSYVWIANSQQGTVSKINTRTLVEEARFDTGGTSPSRTSVSVDGRAVVVANRGVGLAKIWARPDFCDPNKNGTPGLQTSTGRTDVLPWGQDDCVEWFQDMQSSVPGTTMTVQRPVQWTSGNYNTSTCTYENQKVWTTTGAMGSGPTQCGQSGVWVHLLNGDTGAIENTIHLPENEFNCDHTGTTLGLGLGPYGGAVDFNNNFFFHGWGNGKLTRVDFATKTYEIRGGGGYGITVDTKGRVWLASSISRHDWTTGDVQSQNVSTSGGITQDLQGRIWAASQVGVVWVDMETLAIGDDIPLPGSGQVKGVSVDVDGFIWAIRQDDPSAYKIHPDTYAIETYTGLDGPYTYSDMTGGALVNINCNPPVG